MSKRNLGIQLSLLGMQTPRAVREIETSTVSIALPSLAYHTRRLWLPTVAFLIKILETCLNELIMERTTTWDGVSYLIRWELRIFLEHENFLDSPRIGHFVKPANTYSVVSTKHILLIRSDQPGGYHHWIKYQVKTYQDVGRSNWLDQILLLRSREKQA
jgi:hypothetical protein